MSDRSLSYWPDFLDERPVPPSPEDLLSQNTARSSLERQTFLAAMENLRPYRNSAIRHYEIPTHTPTIAAQPATTNHQQGAHHARRPTHRRRRADRQHQRPQTRHTPPSSTATSAAVANAASTPAPAPDGGKPRTPPNRPTATPPPSKWSHSVKPNPPEKPPAAPSSTSPPARRRPPRHQPARLIG